jgi:glycosyltransferase involved in cell wall biosynthesis
MSQPPLVSVCIPAYNAAPHIRATIDSVLASTYPYFEIIVGDDASTDDTVEIVEAIDDPRIRVVRHAENVGPVKNWNRTLALAQGELLSLLNHDDLYGPFWLTFGTYVLQKYPSVAWVITSYRIVDAQARTLAVRSPLPRTRQYDPIESFPRVATLDGLGPGYIVRREALEAVGYYDESAGPGADNDLFLRLAAKYPLYYSDIPHTAWRWHSSNLTQRWSTLQQISDGLDTLASIFSEDDLPTELKRYLKPAYVHFYRKIFVDLKKMLEAGDLESAQQLITLIAAKGYNQNTLEE